MFGLVQPSVRRAHSRRRESDREALRDPIKRECQFATNHARTGQLVQLFSASFVQWHKFCAIREGGCGFREERSPCHVRLQSALRGLPTCKGWGQASNDAIHQFDNARFRRRRRTKRRRMPSSWHRGCVREGGRVEAVWVWSFSQDPNGW